MGNEEKPIWLFALSDALASRIKKDADLDHADHLEDLIWEALDTAFRLGHHMGSNDLRQLEKVADRIDADAEHLRQMTRAVQECVTQTFKTQRLISSLGQWYDFDLDAWWEEHRKGQNPHGDQD